MKIIKSFCFFLVFISFVSKGGLVGPDKLSEEFKTTSDMKYVIELNSRLSVDSFEYCDVNRIKRCFDKDAPYIMDYNSGEVFKKSESSKSIVQMTEVEKRYFLLLFEVLRGVEDQLIIAPELIPISNGLKDQSPGIMSNSQPLDVLRRSNKTPE